MSSPRTFLAPPETAILDKAGIAHWLRVSERTVERLGIPHLPLGGRRRYLVADVLTWFKQRTRKA